jgi:hypothetical protein
MLKKLAAAMNPFAAKRKPLADEVVNSKPAHAHSFSCACKDCVDQTNVLTRARLKRQGA